MKTLLARLITMAVVSMAMLAGVSATAWARPIDDPGTQEQKTTVCSKPATADYQYLPVERWSGATQKLHVRSNGGFIDTAPLQRQIQAGSFVTGDFLYGVTVKFVTWSTQLCPMKAVGGAVDTAAAQLGRALVNSALITGILVCTLVALLLQGMRTGDGGWLKRLGGKLLVLAIFAIMVAGSADSTGGGINGDYSSDYKPGQGSPGWFAVTIDKVVTDLAAAPAAALSSQAVLEPISSGDQLDCSSYLGALQKGYVSHASTGGTLDSAAVPALTVSNLWQISGYSAWSVGQFGNKNLNGQSRVACRMLDQNAGIPTGIGSFTLEGTGAASNRSSAAVVDVMSRVPSATLGLRQTAGYVKSSAPAWRPLAGAEADKAWIAWATCVPKDGQLANLTSKSGWRAPAGNSWLIADDAARKNADTVDGSSKLNAACYDFFNSDSTTVDSIFDWGEGDKELRKHANEMPSSIYDFISALHGTNQTAGGIASLGYLVAAFGVAAVFGSVAAAIIAVKIISLVMLFSVFFCMAAVLLPNADNSKLVRFTKEYFGLVLFAAFAVLVLAMITLFVKVIWLLLAQFTGGPNSLMTMLIGGLAPVLAAYALHRAFVKIGMPSPMTVKGAVGWGQALAGGAAGGAVAAGANQLLGGARDAAGGAGRKVRDLTVGGLRSKFGRSSAGSDGKGGGGAQKSMILPGGAGGSTESNEEGASPKGGSASSSPEDVLANPAASAADKRAAQRQLAADKRGLRHEQQQEKAAAAAADDQVVPERRNGNAVRRSAAAARRVAADRALDTRRWAAATVSHPVTSLQSLGRRIPGGAAAAGGLLVTAAIGGLPAVAAAGSVVAAKHAGAAVQRRIRSHSQARRDQLQAYRHRQRAAAAEADAAAENPQPPTGSPPRPPDLGPRDDSPSPFDKPRGDPFDD